MNIKVPLHYQEIVDDIKSTAREHKIKLLLEDKEFIKDPDTNSLFSGWFSDDYMTLAVATKKPLNEWITVLIHESCHMDQYLEDRYLWEKCGCGRDFCFTEWINEKIELSPERLYECIQDIIRLEKDCEERTISKIKRYQLPLDINTYIQKANAMMYSYLLHMEYKPEISIDFDNPKVYTKAPKEFKNSYKSIPSGLKKAFLSYLIDT